MFSPGDLEEHSKLYEAGLYVSLYEKVNSLGPLHTWLEPDAAVLAGKLAVNLGAARYGNTIHLRAWRRFPDHAELQYYTAWVELRRRGPLAALQHLERFHPASSVDDDFRADWAAQRAHCLAMLRDFQSAEEAMNEAISLAPERPWIYVENASVCELDDRAEASLESALHALHLQPFFRPAVQQAAHSMVQLNRDDDALELLDRARRRLESGAVLSQLACLLVELRRYEEARECFEQLGALFPLVEHDKEMKQWLAARRSDAAYFCGDYRAAEELAREVDRPFFKAVAKRMARKDANGRRVELNVGFVRQNYSTCAPATLAAICRYWDRPFDHLEVAESICYDGTPDHNERHWVEEHGFYAREFRVTAECSQALIDAGIPFTLTTVGPGVAHLQAVFGYDSRRGVLLVRDPNERHFSECLTDEMIENQTSTGPRGMAFVPEDDAGRLRVVELPDSEFYDDYYELQRALHDFDRDAAEEAYGRMAARDQSHRLAIHGRARLAHYDSDNLTLAACTDRLLALFPDDVNQQMARLRILRENGTRNQRLELLDAICGKKEFDPSFRRLYAEELLDDGREIEQAAYLLRRSTRARPLDAENLRLQANLCWGRRQREEALKLLRFAACLEDKSESRAIAYFTASRYLNRTEEALQFLKDRFRRYGGMKGWPGETLATAHEQLEQQEEAIKVLEEALRLRPDDGELMLTAAKHFSRLRRDEVADQLLERAKDRCFPLAWLQAMAYRAWYRNDLNEALRYGREVLAVDPFNQEMNEVVAGVLHNLQGPEAAEAHLRESVDRYPYHYLLRVQLIEALPDDDRAKKEGEVRKFLELHGLDPWARRELALALCRDHRYEEAMVEAKTAVELEGTNPVGHFICALVHEGLGDPEAARDSCRKAIEMSVDYEPAIYKLVEMCQTKAERQQELGFLYEQLVDQVTFGEGLLTFREVADRTIERDRLLQILREALEVRPDLWQAWSAVIYQLIDMERGEEAVATAKSALERFPLLPRMSLDLAAAYQAAGDPEGEMDAIGKALTLNPTWGETLRQRSEALRRLGDLDGATNALEIAISYEPRNVTHQGELADVLWSQGKRDEAIAALREAVHREPRYEWGWRKLREWSGTTRQPELVVELGREIVGKRPESGGCWMLLAEILDDFPEHFEECLAAVDHAIQLNPRNPEAHSLRAQLLARTGRFDDAVEACRPSVFAAQRPKLLRVKEADIESQRGRNAEAVEELKAVVAEDPEYAHGWSRLADCYDVLGENEKYLESSQQLIRIAPRHAAAWGYVGDGLLRVGRRDEAKQHLQRAVELDPTYTFAGVRLFESQMEDKQYAKALDAIDLSGPHLPDDYYIACRIRALIARRDDSASLEEFERLARCKMDDSEAMLQAVDAFWEADRGELLRPLLDRLVAEDGMSTFVGSAWVRQVVRCGDHRAVRRKLEDLSSNSELWIVVCREYVRYLGQAGNRGEVARVIREHRQEIRAKTSCWASVGAAYRDLSLNREVIEWMADWRSRQDVEAGMLFPLVLSRLAVKDRRGAADAAGHAIGLTIDRSFDFHLIWLAAIGLFDNNTEQAVSYFSRVNPSGYSEYYQQLYGLLATVLDILTGPSGCDWLTARERLRTARRAIHRDHWRDPVLRRLYWRCRATVAARCGSPATAVFAKAVGWFC